MPLKPKSDRNLLDNWTWIVHWLFTKIWCLWTLNFPVFFVDLYNIFVCSKQFFLTFPACWSIPIIFSSLNSNCSNLLDMRNLQQQVKKAFCYQKLFWPFTARINCSSDLKNFANSRPSASNFKSFPRSREQFFLTVVGQNNFGNKIQFIMSRNFFLQKFEKLQDVIFGPM